MEQMTPDPVRMAAEYWGKGQGNLFEFAVACSQVVGKRDGGTQAIINQIREREGKNISADSVERYAKGGELWVAMLQKYPQDAESFRAVLDIGYWNCVGRLLANETITLAGAKHWLDEAVTNKWTVETLRGYLPVGEGRSGFKREAIIAAGKLEKLMNHETLNVNDKEYKRLRRILPIAAVQLRKVAE